MDREDYTHQAASGALEQAEQPPYEPPTVTMLGSFTELTEGAKTGSANDPGAGFQQSQV
jgi:hypothetical protein